MAPPNNPMARFAVKQANPLDDVMRMRRQQEARRIAKEAPRRLNEIVRNALSVKLMGGGDPQVEVVGAASPPRGVLYGGMAGVPTTERDVLLRDRREKMRGAFLERLRQDRAARPEEYSGAERMYEETASKRGKFLKRAYDAVGTPEGMSDFDVAIMRSQGMVNPLLDEYNQVTRERVAKEFQRTHKWARKNENLADLDIAVKYLMSQPNFNKSFYYNP